MRPDLMPQRWLCTVLFVAGSETQNGAEKPTERVETQVATDRPSKLDEASRAELTRRRRTGKFLQVAPRASACVCFVVWCACDS